MTANIWKKNLDDDDDDELLILLKKISSYF